MHPTNLSHKVEERTGLGLGTGRCDGEVVLPNGAALSDGLTEEEAALIALWNNAAFQELLTELGIARGDLVQAGLLPNPEVAYFFSVSGKPFKYALDLPIEALWLRPIRIQAARREVQRVRERLTQGALDLVRDVRQAYAVALLAKGRQRVAEEAVALRKRISSLAEARLEAGDISVQEAATAGIDALRAEQEGIRAGADVALAEERLRNLLGMGEDRSALELDFTVPAAVDDLDVEALTAEGVDSRPDALAAEQNVGAAAERLRLAQLGWVRFLGIADATSGTRSGHEFGPAFRATLPLFNRNQGGIARAASEHERARRQRQTVHDQIVLDVRGAYLRYTQAGAELKLLEERVLPGVEAAIRRSESGYREGETSYLVVLETTRQLLEGRLRREELQAEVRRAWADLERSVGRRLDETSEAVEQEGGAT